MVAFTCISSGATSIITAKEFTPALELDIIQTFKVTHLFNIPGYLEACLKHDQIEDYDCSCVQQIITYGFKLREQTKSQVNRFFSKANLISSYGLTEIGKLSN